MKKIIIASFFVAILMLIPCTQAITIPLNTDEQQKLNELYKQENQEIQESLEVLINEIEESDGILYVNTIEQYLHHELFSPDPNNPSVTDTDTWGWIIERLGWVYLTSEYVINFYAKGTLLFTLFSAKFALLTGWYASVKNVITNWQAFKDNPVFENIINLINSLGATLTLTYTIISDLLDGEQELIDALTNFSEYTQELIEFLEDDPWTQPIQVYGIVSGVDDIATISCKSASVETNGSYTLDVPVIDEARPWWIHNFVINANFDTNEKTQESYSFAMGRIEANFDFTGSKDLNQIRDFSIISNLLDHFPMFKNLITVLISLLF
jgi:hypothetical protein